MRGLVNAAPFPLSSERARSLGETGNRLESQAPCPSIQYSAKPVHLATAAVGDASGVGWLGWLLAGEVPRGLLEQPVLDDLLEDSKEAVDLVGGIVQVHARPYCRGYPQPRRERVGTVPTGTHGDASLV